MSTQPGIVVLFGSGETAASGRRVYDWLFGQLSSPPQVAVLETPAGFEPNSDWVAGQVADFIRQRLQNYRPQLTIVPARKRGTPYSPDDPAIVAPLFQSDAIFLGPGSPTYTVRQLQNSLAWQALLARHYLGAAVILASAATLAFSAYTLPVYEIYKVGEDLHWQPGLDLFGRYGLPLVFIPHWNNNDGGANLDTTHCYLGQQRFEQLLKLLPSPATIIGLDEHTALILNLSTSRGQVMGRGGITVLRNNLEKRFSQGETLALSELGPFQLPTAQPELPAQVWQQAQQSKNLPLEVTQLHAEPPAAILALLAQRQIARAQQDWAQSDALRQQLAGLGWQVLDTPQGPRLEPITEN
jgi:hypothetical protein